MEGSNSEAIFESLNLSPQLFINEVLNIVDDLLDEAFNFLLQEGSTLLKVEGTDRSADLSKGVAYIRDVVQLALDQRMQKWKEYCLRFCFCVPEGFALPKAGVAYIRDVVQLALDQRMQKWKEYCLRFCFCVPEGFALPKANEMSGDDLPDIDALTDTELDAELNSLRDKLTSEKNLLSLTENFVHWERQSSLSNQSAGSIDEALQLYKENDVHQMFQGT
ncbi:UNVERIFIED_CONTAM: protein MIS12 [Sesamum latifolium]|uniref:Protein MIS12 n=1 Tax=Sesamum latifolium TaxID=2727402 RepID=A0AAW2YAJ1_9LAMI